MMFDVSMRNRIIGEWVDGRSQCPTSSSPLSDGVRHDVRNWHNGESDVAPSLNHVAGQCENGSVVWLMQGCRFGKRDDVEA